MKTARTLCRPDLVTGVDSSLGNSILWRADCHTSGISHVVADLSYDLVWRPGAFPVVSPRTCSYFSVPLRRWTSTVGVRFHPAVTSITLDRTWDGWRVASDDADTRQRRIFDAIAEGALESESDPRLAIVFSQLDKATVRVPSIARELHSAVASMDNLYGRVGP